MLDYLLFRKMIAPILLKILFWPALAATVYYSTWLIREGMRIGWGTINCWLVVCACCL